MKKFWITCALLSIVSACLSCHIRTDKDTDAIRRAMNSLVYVGDAPDRPGPKAGDHGSVQLPFPDRLLKGRQYIFHRRRAPYESWVIIEKALRANGAEIIDAPRGNVGLVYAYVGGPFFLIEFRMGKLHCWIRNTMAAELASGGLGSDLEQHDFVLRIE